MDGARAVRGGVLMKNGYGLGCHGLDCRGLHHCLGLGSRERERGYGYDHVFGRCELHLATAKLTLRVLNLEEIYCLSQDGFPDLGLKLICRVFSNNFVDPPTKTDTDSYMVVPQNAVEMCWQLL